MASLRAQLVTFWLLLLLICGGLGIVMMVLYQNSAGVQIGEARRLTEQVCESIAERYAQSAATRSQESADRGLMQVVLQLALVEAPHVEGGIWSSRSGFLAYAYPTYEGGGVKSDVPEAERPHITEVATSAARAQSPQTDILRGAREALVLTACPLSAAGSDAAIWTMTRVPAEAEAALRNLRIGLLVLLLAVLSSGVWLGAILARSYHHVRQLETALGSGDAMEAAPPLRATGVEELDRIIGAVNRHSARLEASQSQARDLLQQQARDQRLSALGRMTGGIAHEIRNPIAAMRLNAENALAATPDRHSQALRDILLQIERLDGLVRSLLALVQPLQLQPESVLLRPWLEERRAQQGAQAESKGIVLTLESEIGAAHFDPLHLGRALDNLLENAIRHVPSAGRIDVFVSMRADGRAWRIRVKDSGSGVPADLQEHLFEPFATSRADGTGLGLALVREIALAHGGDVRYVREQGSCFEVELPWRAS
jgi:signal transduction histidine kinase